jgi:hypothetical protein
VGIAVGQQFATNVKTPCQIAEQFNAEGTIAAVGAIYPRYDDSVPVFLWGVFQRVQAGGQLLDFQGGLGAFLDGSGTQKDAHR